MVSDISYRALKDSLRRFIDPGPGFLIKGFRSRRFSPRLPDKGHGQKCFFAGCFSGGLNPVTPVSGDGPGSGTPVFREKNAGIPG